MPLVTFTLPNTPIQYVTSLNWELPFNSYARIPASLSSTNNDIFFAKLFIRRTPLTHPSSTAISFRFAANQTANPDIAGPDLSPTMETSGTFTLTASNGSSLIINGPFPDTSEPYQFTQGNWADSAQASAFGAIVNGLNDRSLTITFDDNAGIVPSFADPTGDAQSWEFNTAIIPITVPLATGNADPTYAAVGALPTGISFDIDTRVISGTPTVTGIGTITIRAANSEGTSDWTMDYSIAIPVPETPVAPTLSVNTPGNIMAVGTAPASSVSPIISYDWRYKRIEDSEWIEQLNQASLSQTFTGLDQSTEYEFQFLATNAGGNSDYSDSAIATTLAVHNVDAGPAVWTFDLPQPTVTHGMVHRVNAGAAVWTFDLPQPTVTHGMVHRVNAGAAVWTFNLPQPTVKHGTAHRVNAGPAVWTFNLPQPTVKHGTAHRVNAGPAVWTFNLPQPSIHHVVLRSFVNLDTAFGTVSYRLNIQNKGDLLVLQWQNSRLRTLMDAILDVMHRKLVLPIRELEYRLTNAHTWQLDAIGSILNFPRPNIAATNLPVFGFSGSGTPVVGFDQGYFRSVNANLSPRTGIDDVRYRRLLNMRAQLIVSRYTIPELDLAVQEVVPDAQYQDHANLNLTLYIGTALTDSDKELYLPYWPKPAGVGLTINDSVALPIV